MYARYVTLGKFAELTGYSAKAAQRKIERGDWLEGDVYVRPPDNRILVDMEGFKRWVNGKVSGSRRPAA